MRLSPLGRPSTRLVPLRRAALSLVALLVVSFSSTPGPVWSEDFEESETEEERAEQLMETILEVLRHSAAHRSLLDDVDPVRGSRADRLVAYTLRTTRLALRLEDHSVEEVVDFLRQVSGLNFVISPRAREALEEDEGRVSFLLNDLTLENFLNLLDSRLEKLRFTVRYGAIILVRNDEYRPRRMFRVYEIRDIVRRPRDFPAPRLGLGDYDRESR